MLANQITASQVHERKFKCTVDAPLKSTNVEYANVLNTKLLMCMNMCIGRTIWPVRRGQESSACRERVRLRSDLGATRERAAALAAPAAAQTLGRAD